MTRVQKKVATTEHVLFHLNDNFQEFEVSQKISLRLGPIAGTYEYHTNACERDFHGVRP